MPAKTITKKKSVRKRAVSTSAKKKVTSKRVGVKKSVKKTTKKEVESKKNLGEIIDSAKQEKDLYELIPVKYRRTIRDLIKKNKEKGFCDP